MKNHLYQPSKIALTVITIMGISSVPVFAADVNLNGSANLNLNPANNNKYTTPMRNFSPGTIPLDHVDLTPLGTEPPTAEIKMMSGNKSDVVVVDKDVKDAKEAKELRRKTGQLVSKSPEIPADDAQINNADIQDFLGNYYKYLRTEGLSSATLPVIPNNDPAPKAKPSTKVKQTSFTDGSEQKGLQAKEQKLLISKTPSAKVGAVPNSP